MKKFLPLSLCVLGAVIALLLAAGCTGAQPAQTGTASANPTTPEVTMSPALTEVPVTTTSTPSPTPASMFPGALALKEKFVIGGDEKKGEATVYRYWLNDTYHWHNSIDLRDYSQTSPEGSRYLIIFVNIVNTGNSQIQMPSTNAIHLWYAGNEYAFDPDHYKDGTVRTENNMLPPAIDEIEFSHQVYSAELVSDYGYSHGKKLGAVYPGESNALDGYLIYVVPASLTPDQTYVQITFNSQDTAVWKLA
jgi:hypothetical protein